MGNDGGSIPTRRELVKEAARNPSAAEVKESQQEQQEYHWTTDPISLKPLAQPVVSDCAGRLYNKDTILEYLVEGTRKEEADRITRGAVNSLKDVVEVKFEVDDDATAKAKRETWKCPITGDKLGPGSKAVYLVPCGHAFSGTTIKEVSGEKCLTCETEYASNDIVPILPTAAEDIARLSLRKKTLQEKGLAHSLKKAAGGKKRKKKDGTIDAAKAPRIAGMERDGSVIRASTPKNGHAEDDGSDRINNSSTASLTAKVLDEQDRAKKRKLDSENVRSLFSTRDQSKLSGKSADFMTRGYSLPAAPKR
ncbi:Rtf2 RING-finger [Teratosphaeria destructans]|uniref:Rtf2 RING-finger n=1 Tax=Teratosphaeria destructans TaxID=418781 RepID=A0A9W7SQ64_9PEZI|nr:Rtf2 RING-finger [Teratosphaeria destructans]